MEIKGNCVYSKLKYESGVHRVQSVPQAEAQGRVHTSTATVPIMPEVYCCLEYLIVGFKLASDPCVCCWSFEFYLSALVFSMKPDEFEIDIDPKDIELKTARSGGAGGKDV